MDLLPSAEQDALVAVVERVCMIDDPIARGAAAVEAGLFDDDAMPPDAEAVVFRALGRHLAPVGWLAAALAAPLGPPPGPVGLAEPHGAGTWRVLDGSTPGSVLAVGRRDVRLLDAAAVLGDARASGPTGFDPGVGLDLVGESVVDSASPLAVDGAAAVIRRGSLLVAALLAGSAERSLARSVAHVGQREQFGRPIGSFQAVAHRCADMAIRVEAAVCAVHLAAASLAAGTAEVDDVIASARLVAADAALHNAADDIQHHGALGFAADLDCHRHLKRAHLLERTLGDPATHVAMLLR